MTTGRDLGHASVLTLGRKRGAIYPKPKIVVAIYRSYRKNGIVLRPYHLSRGGQFDVTRAFGNSKVVTPAKETENDEDAKKPSDN